MREITTTRRKDGPDGEESSILLPDKTFLGVSETDIIAIEREAGAGEGYPPDRRRG